MTKTVYKLRIKGNFLNLIKKIYKNPKKLTLPGGKVNVFSLS